MERTGMEQRLSRISTQWSLVFEAHGPAADASQAALRRLLQRYSGAAYRYLLGALRDEDAAQDLAQSFAVKLLEGRFKGAKPEKGRFRHYLKTALIHLVTDYHNARKADPRFLNSGLQDLAAAADEPASEERFLASWREELLDRTWRSLESYNATYHAVLWMRIESPDLASQEMAEQLTLRLEKPINAASVRKSLQRAHEKFGDLLLDEVAASLESPSLAEVEQELQTIELLKYCRSALDRRRA